ncbi:MAG: hypothetical protein ACJ749_02210 [Flavisolibacter sp.]
MQTLYPAILAILTLSFTFTAHHSKAIKNRFPQEIIDNISVASHGFNAQHTILLIQTKGIERISVSKASM